MKSCDRNLDRLIAALQANLDARRGADDATRLRMLARERALYAEADRLGLYEALDAWHAPIRLREALAVERAIAGKLQAGASLGDVLEQATTERDDGPPRKGLPLRAMTCPGML